MGSFPLDEIERLKEENARLLDELERAYGALEVLLGEEDRERDITYAELQERTGRLQEANAQLQASLREKEVLLKEVHHRVKNNIQVVSSLLSLQARAIGDERLSEVFTESQNRLRAMALIHERLYTSGDLAQLDFSSYIRQLATDLFQAYRTQGLQVGLEFEVEPVLLDVNTAISCGLILNELVSNAFKHAFSPGSQENARICIRLRHLEDEGVVLAVRDNGKGLPAGVNLSFPTTLGLKLVKGLVSQIGGELNCRSAGGTEFEVVFGQKRAAAPE